MMKERRKKISCKAVGWVGLGLVMSRYGWFTYIGWEHVSMQLGMVGRKKE